MKVNEMTDRTMNGNPLVKIIGVKQLGFLVRLCPRDELEALWGQRLTKVAIAEKYQMSPGDITILGSYYELGPKPKFAAKPTQPIRQAVDLDVLAERMLDKLLPRITEAVDRHLYEMLPAGTRPVRVAPIGQPDEVSFEVVV